MAGLNVRTMMYWLHNVGSTSQLACEHNFIMVVAVRSLQPRNSTRPCELQLLPIADEIIYRLEKDFMAELECVI